VPGLGAPISPRYPAVEALTALLFIAVTWHDGWSFALGFDLAFGTAILALIFIDAEHMILPNAITYPRNPLCFDYARSRSFIWLDRPLLMTCLN